MYVVLPDKLSFEIIDDFGRQQIRFGVTHLSRPNEESD